MKLIEALAEIKIIKPLSKQQIMDWFLDGHIFAASQLMLAIEGEQDVQETLNGLIEDYTFDSENMDDVKLLKEFKIYSAAFVNTFKPYEFYLRTFTNDFDLIEEFKTGYKFLRLEYSGDEEYFILLSNEKY